MTAFADILFVATALAYLASCVLFLLQLEAKENVARSQWISKYTPRIFACGVSLHAAQIVVASLLAHVCPVQGVHFAMSVVSALVGVTYLAARRRHTIDIVGVFVAPFALTFLVASHFASAVALAPKWQNRILPFHIVANMAGVAMFTLAFAAAVAYLLQEQQLKKKMFSGVSRRLPPLDELDKAEHRFILFGFPLLTFGVLSGALWAHEGQLTGLLEMTREALGYVCWILFGGVLLLRAVGWRGRKAAFGTIAGFSFAVLVLLFYVVRSVAFA